MPGLSLALRIGHQVLILYGNPLARGGYAAIAADHPASHFAALRDERAPLQDLPDVFHGDHARPNLACPLDDDP
ncbi:hypothetical protein D3C87_1715330 [compost metagenome]